MMMIVMMMIECMCVWGLGVGVQWGMGFSNFELVRGIDCPATAIFQNVTYMRGGTPRVLINGICVFEQELGIPIRRHYEKFGPGSGYNFYGGAASYALVIRTIAAVYNYGA